MRLVWRPFRVCLPKFDDFVNTIPGTDGIIATPMACYVMEKSPLAPEGIANINAYWDGLDQDTEAEAFRTRELAAREAQRQSLKEAILDILKDTE